MTHENGIHGGAMVRVAKKAFSVFLSLTLVLFVGLPGLPTHEAHAEPTADEATIGETVDETTGGAAESAAAPIDPDAEYVEGEVIVIYKEQMPDTEAVAAVQEEAASPEKASKVDGYSDLTETEQTLVDAGVADQEEIAVGDEQPIVVASLTDDVSVEEAVRTIAAAPEVEYVQPNYVYTLADEDDEADVDAPEGDVDAEATESTDASEVATGDSDDAATEDDGASADAAGETGIPDEADENASADATDAAVETLADGTEGAESKQYHLDASRAREAWKTLGLVDDDEGNGLPAQHGVTVAVVDSGCDLDHEDLSANLDVDRAKSFVEDNPNDGFGHGTHVSGIIGAASDGGVDYVERDGEGAVTHEEDIQGVTHNVAKVLPVRVADSSGGSTTARLRAGLGYLAGDDFVDDPNAPLRVVNLSLKVSSRDEVVHEQIQALTNKGILVVCAAGNDGNGAAVYPSDFKECLSVMSLKRDANSDGDSVLLESSSYNEAKDICASGESILSTVPYSGTDASAGFGKKTGTSMAAPIVSGAAALLFYQYPDLTPEQAKIAICESANPAVDDLGRPNGSSGAIDVQAMLDYAAEHGNGIAWTETYDLSSDDVTVVGKTAYTYSETAISPSFAFKVGGKLLNDRNYETDPSPCSAKALPGTYQVTITGKNQATGSYTFDLTIKPAQIGDAYDDVSSVTYNGQAQTPPVKLTFEGRTLVEGTDYILEYSNNVNAGEAIVGITGKGVFEGNSETGFTIKPAKLTKTSLSPATFTYNGAVRKPGVTVQTVLGGETKTLASKATDSTSNFTVSYASGRKKVGTYAVTVKGRGNYTGTLRATLTIRPKTTSITKLTRKKKSFKVKWKKVTTENTGYQIRWSTKSDLSNAKTKTISKAKTTSNTVKNQKAKTRYYVQVRTYKKVGGKKIYGAWSKTKSVVTK